MKQLTPIADCVCNRKFAIILLASALTIPAFAQQAQPAPQQTQQTQDQANQPSSTPPTAPAATSAQQPGKEGFWGRVNPFARKKWVKKQIDPMNDRLNELDELSSKNSRDIKDVDSRAQAGIGRAQSTADAANQNATLAGNKAQQANTTAMAANGHVDTLNTTVNNLDNYNQKDVVEIAFRSGQPVLSTDAKSQLDDLAAKLNGQPGYILELEAHAPGAGSVGIQSSKHLTDAVVRYLVVKHDIPVYRIHSVALGNAPMMASAANTTGSDNQDATAKPKPIHKSTVSIRLMENSLAAQGSAAPLAGAASLSGTAQP